MFRAGFPDLRFTAEEVLTSGDKVVVRARVTGTHQGEFMGIPPTGKSVNVPVIDIMRFGDDGLAHEHWGIFDQMKLMQQLGVAPGPGAPRVRSALPLASGEQLGQNRPVSDELDALIAALQRPLSVEDEADGWTDQARARWLAYFSGLREGIRVATDSERAAAPSQLGRWLDYEGIGARHSPLTEAVTRAQLSLVARGEAPQPPRDVPEPTPTPRHHASALGIPDFEAYRDALRRHGFREAAAQYDERPFGSWFIAVEGNPSSRLLWDGKDEWLLVQRRAGDTWFDVWVARDEHDRTPTSAIEQLERLRDSS